MSQSFIRPKTLVAVMLGVVFIAVGLYFYQNHRLEKQDAEKVAFYKALKLETDEISALTPEEKEVGVALDFNQKFSKSFAAYDALIASAKSPQVRAEVILRKSRVLMDHGGLDQAIALLRSAFSDQKGFLKSTLGIALAQALETQAKVESDWQAIAEIYRDVGKSFAESEALALSGQVRALVKANKKDQAKTVFEALKKKFAGSPEVQNVEGLI